MEFRYKAYGKDGKIKRGIIESESRKVALSELKEEGLRVFDIKEKKSFKLSEGQRDFLVKVKEGFKVFDIFKIGLKISNRKKSLQLESLKEELFLMGYDDYDISDFLKGINVETFDIDKFVEFSEVELSLIQIEKIRSGRIIDKGRKKESSVVGDKLKNSFGISDDELIIFTEQVAILISTEVALLDALETVQKNLVNKKFIRIIDQLIYDLSKGMEFSVALSSHEEVFDKLYVAMVKVGESTGSELSNAMEDLVKFLKMKNKVKKEVKKALIYPAIVMVILVILLTVINTFVIPRMQEVYIGMDLELPTLTKVIFLVSENIMFVVIAILLLILILAYLIIRVDSMRSGFMSMRDWMVVKLPILRNTSMSLLMYQLSMTMYVTLRNGISITDSLNLINGVVNNKYLKKDVEDIYYDLLEGVDISRAFESKEYVTPIVKTAVGAGEKSGKLADTVEKVSVHYESDLESKMSTLISLITPLVIVVLGLVIGPFIIGAYLPMIELTQQISKM